MSKTGFVSFSPSIVTFLKELARHNERDWFQANKPRYEAEVLGPALAFVDAMAPRLKKVSPHFTAIPKRTGGSLMRIYRDTRFSADKRPYKTNVGIQFRHERGRDVHAPGFYFHIDPDQVFLGAGLWRPESTALAEIRSAIADSPSEWREARSAKAFAASFDLGGESLKRPPRGFPPDHPHVEDLKRKDFIAVHNLSHNDLYRPDLLQIISARMGDAAPFMRFLCEATGVPF